MCIYFLKGNFIYYRYSTKFIIVSSDIFGIIAINKIKDFIVPEVSRFLGIIITFNYDDHNPPHFHARYGEYQGLFLIKELP